MCLAVILDSWQRWQAFHHGVRQQREGQERRQATGMTTGMTNLNMDCALIEITQGSCVEDPCAIYSH